MPGSQPATVEEPVASIVIPAHNAAAFLADALDSARAQTLRAIEILVVDDGSTDATAAIAEAAAAQDRRVRLVSRARRGGPSSACNSGIEAARGRWIVVLDADDMILPGRTERLVARAEALGADLIADNLIQQDFATGEEIGPLFPESMMREEAAAGPMTPARMLRLDMPDMPGRARLGYVQPVKRRAFLQRTGVRFAEDVGTGEDFLFYFECVARGARFHLVPEAGYVYRIRRGSVSNIAPSAALFVSAANRRLLQVAATHGDPAVMRTLRRRQVMLDFDSFRHAVEARRFGTALRHAHLGRPGLLLAQWRVLAAGLFGAQAAEAAKTEAAARPRIGTPEPSHGGTAGPG